MTTVHLLTRIIVFAVGIILHYYSLPKAEKIIQEQTTSQKLSFSLIGSMFKEMSQYTIGSIFIILGLFGILSFCLGIDIGNYTPEKEDDITILSGIVIGICLFSLERNIASFLQKLKYRKFKIGIVFKFTSKKGRELIL